MHERPLVIGSLVLGLGACGKGPVSTAESVASQPKPPLSARDLAPLLPPTPVVAAEVPSELSLISELYANFPADSASGSASACDNLVNSQPVEAKGDTLIWSFALDLGPCSGLSTIGVNLVTDYMQIVCAGGDLSPLNGKTWREVTTAQRAWSCTSIATLSESIQDFSVAFGGISTKQRSESYIGTPDLQPCAAGSPGQPYADGCLAVTNTLASDSAKDGVTTTSAYSRLEFHGVRSESTQVADATSTPPAPPGPWYRSGEIALIFSDWQGAVTYAGANVSPTYELASASGQKISGQLHAYTPSSFKAPSLSGLVAKGELLRQRLMGL